MLLLKTILFVTLMAVSMGNHSCPDYWTVHGNHCYQYQSEKITWSAAQTHCRNLGAQLVSINNHDENEFVKWLTANSHESDHPYGSTAWLGLDNYHNSGTKYWEDGTQVTYENFYSGQPNDWDGLQDCIEMNHYAQGYWSDYNCEQKIRFVCEAENPTPTSLGRSRRSEKRGRCEL